MSRAGKLTLYSHPLLMKPTVTRTEPSTEYYELEARQTKILSQLADLKEQVSTLCYFLKHSNEATKLNKNEIPAVSSDVSSTQKCVENSLNHEKQECILSLFLRGLKSEVKVAADHVPFTQKPVSTNMIIHVGPYHPPFSLNALMKVWKDVDIRTISYKQSTTNRSTAIQFFRKKTFKPAAKIIVNLSLIWRNIRELEIVTDIDRYKIFGEVNLLRYFSRLIDTHNYEKIHPQPHLLDTVLDWCYKTREHLETKEYTYDGVEFHTITHNIDKWSNYKDEPNIADIAVWSLFKQYPLNKKPQVLNELYDICEKKFDTEMNTNL
ncbi:uncharacterized protein LOC114934857 isoform X2 [Nylanderia fulva]|uniref:uncharacterized protein LOC114934857 isoform X2 n=1 Tax=Nylanderia fulva TaxID=613905 RepID=UPI0010FAD7CC|nr:uncharacterized protein LOC114934857 isoform X2 [Nylanderia fulva]